MIKHLSLLGRITTPAAMVVFMAYEINRSMVVEGYWNIFVLLGAVLTAVGVEIVGILSGSTLEGFWRQGNAQKSLLSLFLLIVYTGAAVFILRGNSTLWPVPIVAAVVYLVSALADGRELEERKQERSERDDVAWERRRVIERERMEHEARLRKDELAAQVKIEQVRAKVKISQTAPQIIADNRRESQSAALYECACGQVYDKPQSYSAHTRHCEMYRQVSQNGRVAQ